MMDFDNFYQDYINCVWIAQASASGPFLIFSFSTKNGTPSKDKAYVSFWSCHLSIQVGWSPNSYSTELTEASGQQQDQLFA